jgi:NAD(P)-dependent dehydrogenase (short-subunit alcohol dehydrogenase family)
MSTVCITGSASGIGAATRARLEADGHRVIGVDLHDAEVTADLATPGGRAAMVDGVEDLCGGRLDGLVAGAGVQGLAPSLVVSINYFGAVATLEGLRPLLARGSGASAVAISSNSATAVSGIDGEAVDACLAGDEARARARLEDVGGFSAYPSSKLALARWVRRNATTGAWIGAGIRLNAIAPGPTATPMARDLGVPVLELGDIYPVPIGRMAEPAEIASVLAFLLSAESSYVVGALLPVDGGGDAAARHADWPTPRP